MTMIVSYSFGEKAIFISDYRLTLNKNFKYDNTLKFIDIDKNIGLFMSGKVQYWRFLLKEIKNTYKDININNILDKNGPFREALITAALKEWNGISRASGYIINEKQKINKQFYIKATAGSGCILEETKPNSPYIFGSGRSIPNIKNKITEIINWYQKNGEDDLYIIGSGIRSCIKNWIKAFK